MLVYWRVGRDCIRPMVSTPSPFPFQVVVVKQGRRLFGRICSVVYAGGEASLPVAGCKMAGDFPGSLKQVIADIVGLCTVCIYMYVYIYICMYIYIYIVLYCIYTYIIYVTYVCL